jgi:putative inorganic carbon (hco3(-)) transporter
MIMAWFFFILLNCNFFIRPAELFEWGEIPIYNYLMIACLATSVGPITRAIQSATESPITVCILGLVVACVLSHLSHGNIRRATDEGLFIAKIVVYMLLLIGVIDTSARLRSFLALIVGLTALMSGLSVLQYHGTIDLHALQAIDQRDIDPETGAVTVIPRLSCVGIFSDPNDLSTLLVLSTIVCLFFFDSTASKLRRCLWLVPPGLFLYALKLTYSRGGLINLALSLLILCRVRLGGRKTLGVWVLAIPLIVAMFGGRQTRIDPTNKDDTSQHRIQLWAEGFNMFREAPFFGVGMNVYSERTGLVAHNSYVNSYAELGFVGGTLFAGAFYAAFRGLRRLGSTGVVFSDPFLMKLRPYLFTIVCSYCIGMLSLSRAYNLPTYMVLGIAGAYLRIAEPGASIAPLRFDVSFLKRILVVGVACLVGLYLFVRIMVRY